MKMKNPTKILLYIGFLLCFSCEDQGLIVNCTECTANEPLETNLDIKFDDSFSGSPVIFDVYEGVLEDHVLYSSDTLVGSGIKISVTLNKKYTVTATYTSDSGTKYIAVDSAWPKVKYEQDQCDDPCFFIYGKDVDLRIKYLK
jgi:hypothetical protein